LLQAARHLQLILQVGQHSIELLLLTAAQLSPRSLPLRVYELNPQLIGNS
jgi:hypothetical protein|tara:strand:- start:737 stop:886 length:150 start_codon:yes stop_codon:yes gene_type:complete